MVDAAAGNWPKGAVTTCAMDCRRTRRRPRDTTTGRRMGLRPLLQSASRVDGPGIRATLFLSGCLLRCQYCHNPDTWHLRDGRKLPAAGVIDRIAAFAPALRTMGGGITLSGGEPLLQAAFSYRLFAAAK